MSNHYKKKSKIINILLHTTKAKFKNFKFKKIKMPLVIFVMTLIFILAFLLNLQNKKSIKVSNNKNSLNLNYEGKIKPQDSKPIIPNLESKKNGLTLKLPILMYHHVGNFPANANQTRKNLTVSKENFTNQVKWLKDNNYNSISLQNLLDYSKGNFVLPKKPIIFTFDDGYLDVFENAIPILNEYGYKGSFAIITQFPENPNQGDNIYATWPEIAKAYLQGQEIVSHTQNHFDGSDKKFSADFIKENLLNSKIDIKNNLGIDVNILIYPYGHYSAMYIWQAKAAGFTMGLTVHEGKELDLYNLMEIPRLRVSGTESLEKFIKMISEKHIHRCIVRQLADEIPIH